MRKELIERKTFVKISSAVRIPDLLDIQLKSFRDFLQDDVKPEKRKSQGLQEVFEKVFPITDSRENYILEFVEYYVDVAGDYRAEDLDSREARVSLSGLGSAFVRVRDHLDVTISGAGSVKYVGSPTVEKQVTGVGRVERIGD